MLDPLAGPNSTPSPAAITIHVLPHPQGQEVHVTHALQGGWPTVVEVLVLALRIAMRKQLEAEQAPPPLIQPARADPRFRPELG